MPTPIHQTIIRFPEIQLATRDAHKLRGYLIVVYKTFAVITIQLKD